MSLMRFSLESMKELDGGKALEQFQEAVRRIVRDCIERPADKRKRVATLQLVPVPVPTIEGNTIDCDGTKGAFQCKVTLPQWETSPVDFGVQQSGDLIFNPDSPRDHKQMTLIGDDRE